MTAEESTQFRRWSAVTNVDDDVLDQMTPTSPNSSALEGRLPGRNLRKIDLVHDYEPALEIVTGIFARKGERERYADDHPLNLLWNAFAEANPTRSVPAVLPG